MKKNYTWLLLFLLLLARMISFIFLHVSQAYFVVWRSYLGGAMLTQPALFDIAIPLAIILLLRPKQSWGPITARSTLLAIYDTLGLLMFPFIAGLALFVYIQQWFVFSHLSVMTLLRWIQFIAAFVALNMFLDALPIQNRWGRRGIALAAAIVLGPFQDVFPHFSGEFLFTVVPIPSSIGMVMALTALAFRPI